jgi:PAS domain S-box-containing protein
MEGMAEGHLSRAQDNGADPPRRRFSGLAPLTLGRSFLLWLLGVLVLTIVTVSALVLWHEHRVLSSELESQGDLLAHLIALAAADGGSPEYLAILSLTDLAAGEVRSVNGEVLWRYGPTLGEIQAMGDQPVVVERRVEVAAGPWGRSHAVQVTVLLSRARMQRNLASAAIRLVAALGLALAVAMTVGLWMVGRVVRPLNELAELSRSFDPELPVAIQSDGGGMAELAELSSAFGQMTRRLADQQRSLAASERRFRELFSSSPTPLLELDSELVLRGANPAAAPFLSSGDQAGIGRALRDYVIGTSDEEKILAGAARAADGEAVEARWRLPDGELAEVELHLRSSAESDGGYIAAIHDLTDRVRRFGERWQRTFDAMIDGVALVDADGSVVEANRALASNLPVVARALTERAGDEGCWRLRSGDRILECTLTRPSGHRHAILVVRDVTEPLNAEARLREAQKMQAVATLASGVAHDFNNLLAAVQLHLRLLEGEPERANDAVAAIRDLAEQGSEVVGELLLFARSDDDLPPRTFDLGELVRDQLAVLNHLLPEAVALEVGGNAGVVPVVGNPVAVRRLILNLVVNARDAVAETGGVITISVGRRGGRAVLEVSDTGPGIPAEHRERLFEPFFTLRRKGRGSGLGLAVVYAIVSAHGGSIEIAPDTGEGARFIVRLPPGDVAELEPLDEPSDEDADRQRPRVMVVEAAGREAVSLIEALALAGFEVRHAPDPVLADRLRTSWAPQAVVVRDDDEDALGWSADLAAPAVVIRDPRAAHPLAGVVAELRQRIR